MVDQIEGNEVLLANVSAETEAENETTVTASANLLTNGSFENPVLPEEGFGGFETVEGWTAITDGQIEIWRNRLGIEATDGVNFLELDYVDGQDGFSQSVDTVAGQDYTLTFDTRLSEAQDVASQGIEVVWNGEVIATVYPGSTEWEEMSFTVTGTGESDTLTIREPGDGTQNDGLGALLDNFALVADGGPVFNEIVGTDDLEFIDGTVANDRILSLGGNDWINGSLGNDLIDGGAGDYDSINYNNFSGYRFEIDLSLGQTTARDSNGITFVDQLSNIEIGRGSELNDIITGTAGNNTLYGGAGDDIIDGGDGQDSLIGEDGSDTLIGGAGNDSIVGGAGNNVIDGGDGIDFVSYFFGTNFSYSFEIDLEAGTAVGINADGETISDVLSNIENVSGSVLNDTIIGDGEANLLSANAGDDIVDGGAGDDDLIGGEGRDELFGGAGDDRLRGDTGADELTGGEGADVFYYRFSPEDIYGDVVQDFSSDDTIQFKAGVSPGPTFPSFVGSDAFSGVVGQIRAEVVGNDTVIEIDADGDGISDGSMTLLNFTDPLEAEAASGGFDLVAGPAEPEINEIVGTDERDSLFGTDGDDRILALDGDDFLFGSLGNDELDGGLDRDIIDYQSLTNMALNIDLLTGLATGIAASGATFTDTLTDIENVTGSDLNDVIAGDNDRNILTGGQGDDVISGRGGPDNLYGGGGSDQLFGGDGIDHLYGGTGNDLVDGGDGLDVANYTDLDTAGYTLNVDLGAGIVTGSNGAGATFTDQLVNIEWVATTNGDDVVTGSERDDGIQSGGGNDVIFAQAGNDIIYGGDGDDLIAGNDGGDQIRSGRGSDTIRYFDITEIRGDVLIDFSSEDSLLINSGLESEGIVASYIGSDAFSGVAGQIRIEQVGDDSVLHFDDDGDGVSNGSMVIENFAGSFDVETEGDGIRLTVSSTAPEFNRIIGTAENDVILGSELADEILGLQGDDTIDALLGDDLVFGGPGDDILDGSSGNDQLVGGAGVDELRGGTGDDQMWGEDGDDVLDGGTENDILVGGAGDDLLLGGIGDGNDQIYGDDGNDTIFGGLGNDQLFGGQGSDEFLYNFLEEMIGDWITDFSVDDAIAITRVGPSGVDIDSFIGAEAFSGTPNQIRAVIEGNNTRLEVDIDGDGVADGLLLATNFNTGFVAEETTFGIRLIATPEVNEIIGTDERETLAGTNLDDRIQGLGGDDYILGREGNDLLEGGDGDDILVGESGNDLLEGGQGNDRLIGGDGDDRSFGGEGDEDIRGGEGNDYIDGGDGIDTAAYQFLDGFTFNVNLSNGTVTGDDGNGNSFTDQLISIERVATANGNDVVVGDDGENYINANDGDDVIDAAGGDDLIQGGSGADRITGGEGEDYFRFFTMTNALGDVITDFSAGETLQFGGGLSPGPIYIGSESFSNVAGELRAERIGSDTVIQFDIDGDGASDGELSLLNYTAELEVTLFPGFVLLNGTDTQPPTPGTNLLTNGSFENPILPEEGFAGFEAVEGWTAIEDGQIEIWSNRLGIEATDGVNFLELDYVDGLDGFSQAVETVAGQSYTLTFDTRLSETYDVDSQGIEVVWNGEVIATVYPGSTEWEEMSFTVTGTGGSDTLTIREPGDGTQNDGLGALLDNFALVADGAEAAIAGTVKLALDLAESSDIIDGGETSSDFVATVFEASASQAIGQGSGSNPLEAAYLAHHVQSVADALLDNAPVMLGVQDYDGDMGLFSAEDSLIDASWDIA